MNKETIIPSGISLCVNKASNTDCQNNIHCNNNILHLDFGWINIAFSTHSNVDRHYAHDKHIHCILDGYTVAECNSLQRIIHEFLQQGSRSVAKLKGVFALCFINTSQHSMHFFTNKRNSRLYYLCETENEWQIASRVDFLARHVQKNGTLEINQQAVIQFLIRGAFYSNHTLFKSITKIEAATELTFEKNTISKRPYWKLQFAKHPTQSNCNEHDLIAEGHQLIKTALETSLQSFSSPLLFLSGGVDSRIILGLLGEINSGMKIPAITWGVQPIQAGDDLSTAIELAKHTGINHRIQNIETHNFQTHINNAITGVDCRVDILDAPALASLWQSLGCDFDCFINGDECFGWHDKVVSTTEALDVVGWRGLDKVTRISDWIHPEARKKSQQDIERTLQDIIAKTQANTPNDIKDALYFNERIGNMLNSQLISKLPFMQPVQPLLDEDVVEFICRIPAKYRYDKLLLRLILQQKYPELDQLPYASLKALPTAARLQAAAYQNQALLRFLNKELFNNKNQLLTGIVNFAKLESVYHAFYHRSPLPPIKNSLLDKIPLIWRYLPKPENRTPPITGIYRVLALNIYLNQITSA